MVDRAGQQLGNYRLVHLLGQGGFAEVYLGKHIYLDTQAAIKVLHAQIAAQEDIAHFQAEARTIARLVHPNIVRVLDFGVEGTTPFLVVDYAPNGSLRRQYTRGTRLALPKIVSYVNQVASALDYAHDQKVIHRDVKPENMLIGRQDELLLSDFGIALVSQSTRYQSTQGMQELAGTIAYMAPEQIQAQAEAKSDQYSLAVVVYEWLCGTRPFQGTFAEVAIKHTLTPPPPLREKLPALSPKIEAVVMKALAKDSAQRFADVKAFAAALEAVCQGEAPFTDVLPDLSDQSTISAETVQLPSQVIAPAAPPPPHADISAKISAAITPRLPDETPPPTEDVPSLSLHPASQAPAPPQPEEAASKSSTAQPSRRRLARRMLIAGLAGGAVAIGAGIGLAARLTLFRQPGDLFTPPTPTDGQGQRLVTYRGHSGYVWGVAWSPDGKYLASASSDRTVQVWDATSGNPIFTYRGHSDSVYSASWSPNSLRIASASYDKTVQVWDAQSGFFPYTYSGHTSWVWPVAWSPNGKYIASGGGDGTVQVWDATNGNQLFTYRGHSDSVYSVAWSHDSTRIASSSADQTVHIWDALSGNDRYVYQPYATTVWSVAWSPDDQRIASGSDDKTVRVWDSANGDHPYTYYGHSDFVYAVAWSPNGKHIASAGDDKTVQVWDAATGDNAYTYTGHTNTVRAVSWSPDSKYIASASWDKTVQVWLAT